jgi:hypothetical protein
MRETKHPRAALAAEQNHVVNRLGKPVKVAGTLGTGRRGGTLPARDAVKQGTRT